MIEKQDRIDKTHYMMLSALQEEVKSRMLIIRNKQVILDSDVAKLYGIETKAVNQAVKRNADKFPSDYMFHLEKEDVEHLRSQNVTANISAKSRFLPVAFTEKGLYMLATILKSPKATDATFAIIETFAAVRELKRELINLHKETDPKVQQSKMKRFGEVLSDIVMPDLETSEIESTLELNFIIGKIKHTAKRTKTK